MDVVFPVKKVQGNEELRYSLRSLKNVPHDNVHMIGHKPGWVKGVNHIPYEPGPPPIKERHGKWWISWRMLRRACVDPTISDDFILFNDDFFVMHPIDSPPLYHRGPLAEVVRKRNPSFYHPAKPNRKNHNSRSNIYVSAMVETKELLTMLDKPALCYEMHTPMVVNKHMMLSAMEVVEAMSRPGQMHINKRSFYANYWELGGEESADVKIYRSTTDYDADQIFFSTTEKSFADNSIGRIIREQLSERSPYENEVRSGPYNPKRYRRSSRSQSRG